MGTSPIYLYISTNILREAQGGPDFGLSNYLILPRDRVRCDTLILLSHRFRKFMKMIKKIEMAMIQPTLVLSSTSVL